MHGLIGGGRGSDFFFFFFFFFLIFLISHINPLQEVTSACFSHYMIYDWVNSLFEILYSRRTMFQIRVTYIYNSNMTYSFISYVSIHSNIDIILKIYDNSAWGTASMLHWIRAAQFKM